MHRNKPRPHHTPLNQPASIARQSVLHTQHTAQHKSMYMYMHQPTEDITHSAVHTGTYDIKSWCNNHILRGRWRRKPILMCNFFELLYALPVLSFSSWYGCCLLDSGLLAKWVSLEQTGHFFPHSVLHCIYMQSELGGTQLFVTSALPFGVIYCSFESTGLVVGL